MEFDDKNNLTDSEKDAEAIASDEQVANRMQRLNLYFEKENVGKRYFNKLVSKSGQFIYEFGNNFRKSMWTK